ncbi:MAG: SGNH/GDSL hydrolase family protein [Magnetococcales bacterium]|nr:SGNH/GDSL hydrolase family protein [Magnetococcales bacterium]
MPLLLGMAILEAIFGNWFKQDEWMATRQLNIVRDRKITFKVDNLYNSKQASVVYTRDSYGLRGGCGAPKSIDVLTVGGSTTDQRYIGDGETWQDVLQHELQSRLGKSVCIANAGVDGHSTFGHLAAFEHWFPRIPNLTPKYYLLYLGINDGGIRLIPNDGFDTNNQSAFKRVWRHNSAMFQLFELVNSLFTSKAAYAGHAKKPPQPAEYTALEKTNGIDALIVKNTELFGQRLSLLLDKIGQRQGIPICVTQPHLFTATFAGVKKGIENAFSFENQAYNGLDYDASLASINLEMKRLCTGKGRYFVDMAVKSFDVDDFYDPVHSTPKGALRVGSYLAEEFQKQGISF